MRSITRRQLSIAGISTVAAGLLPPAGALLAQTQQPLDEFMAASQAVTGRAKLDPVIGARFLPALEASTPGFGASLSGLKAALDAGTADAAQQKTALAVMRAWYTGMVGNTMVSFERALMFEVVADVLPVRSYCGGKPGFWAENPNQS